MFQAKLMGFGGLILLVALFATPDEAFGQTDPVVKQDPNMIGQKALSNEEKITLLKLARQTLETYYAEGGVPSVESDAPAFQKDNGVFVTLHTKDGQLRGCIGCFQSDTPLYKTIQTYAVHSAINDRRFKPVTHEELKQLDIEISILSEMTEIESIDEIELGTHGIWIRKGSKSGTFLPQVATETGWTLEEFLGHCAQDKAGIGWDGWKDATILTYTTDVFSEAELIQ